MITVIKFRKNGIVTDREKKQRTTHTGTKFCPIKDNVCGYFNSVPLRRNPTQPTPVEFKHLMIGWGKLSEKRTAQSVAVSFHLVRAAATCMGFLALESREGRGPILGGKGGGRGFFVIGPGWERDFFRLYVSC